MVTPPLPATPPFKGGDLEVDAFDLEVDALVPAAPALPHDPHPDYNAHRPRVQEHWPLYNAAVARPIKKKELHENPKALTALTNESEKLKSTGHLGPHECEGMVRGSHRG